MGCTQFQISNFAHLKCHIQHTVRFIQLHVCGLMQPVSRAEKKFDRDETEKDSSDSIDIPSWSHIDFDRDIECGDIIGGGGVGLIYKGWFRGEEVALKTLFNPRVDEKLKKEYMDELLIMSKLKHSNIVSFLGACMTPPNLCFVMEVRV